MYVTKKVDIEPISEGNSSKNDDKEMAFLDFLAFTAIVSTIGMFLTGISICRTIARIGSTRGVSPVPFLLCAVSCLFWLQYGILKKDRTVITINIIGLSLELAYIFYYYAYAIEKKPLHRLLALSAITCVTMMFYVNVVPLRLDKAISHLGFMCLILNILNFGAPLASVKHVMDTKTAESLPLPLIVANLVVAFQWFLYGYLINDVYMTVPNVIGILLSMVQLSLFVIYPVPNRK